MRRRRAKDDYIASWFSYRAGQPARAPSHRAGLGQDARGSRLSASQARPVRFAILGTRGIPARYGGFETFAEELSTRLAARGHTVTVYCRERHPRTGISRRASAIPAHLRHKYLDTIAHTCLSTLHLTVKRFGGRKQDAVLYCNAANAVFTWIPRVLGMPTALNVDGLERNRKKWNRVAKAWYRMSEWLATWMPNVVVTDARRIADYYQERYHRSSEMIPYGAETGAVATAAVLESAGSGAAKVFSLREPHGTGEQRAAGAGGIREAGHADEAGSDRRRALRRGLYPPACATPPILAW